MLPRGESDSTSDHLPPPCVGLQGAEQDLGLVRTVYAALHHLLQHGVHRARPEVVREMLHLLPVQVGATVPLLVDVHTHWEKTGSARR